MNIRRNQLLSAIKSAKLHVDGSANTTAKATEQIGQETKPSNSRMVRLIGKSSSDNERKSLLTRVGVKNRPTYDLVADGILGKDSKKYQPKLSVSESQISIDKTVSERIKDLRARTLSKLSRDDNSTGEGFFGFETDGTPIWSSVVAGDRKIAERMFDADQPQEIYNHSTHIPVNYSWPKRLAMSNHNTFKNWFTVAENRRATQLAEQIIDNPQQGINPLVVVGQNNTGKSHLLHAIGQASLLTCEQDIFSINRDEFSKVMSFEHSWSDVFASASMLIIDDIDATLEDDAIANKFGEIIDIALNMNVHVIVSSQSVPDDWPASRVWDLLRNGVKTILNPPGAGSLMLYARGLAINKSIILTDEQLALIVTNGETGWRSTKNSLGKIETAINNGLAMLDASDVYKILHDIQPELASTDILQASESVEDVASRLINSVVDVVYSDQQLGGIEFNTELPELSDDYQPPELTSPLSRKSDVELIESQLHSTLENLTPVAPSVIDVDDRDKHLIAKMNRIIEQDHSRAAEILTDLDMGIDERFHQSNNQIANDTSVLMNLEAKLLQLAERTADASVDGLIEIADELRSLEHDLLTAGATQMSGSQGTDGELDTYTPTNDWNIDASKVQPQDLVVESSTMIPIGGVLQPHPEGVIRTATITPVIDIITEEEE